MPELRKMSRAALLAVLGSPSTSHGTRAAIRAELARRDAATRSELRAELVAIL